ncbi:MAG: ABC transporter permease [Calditrichaeota bacterium]|nr:MAG: ABC transporter permease [Calditrichota bacterium]
MSMLGRWIEKLLASLPWLLAVTAAGLLVKLAPFLWAYRDLALLLSWQHLRLIGLSMTIAVPLGVLIGGLTYGRALPGALALGSASLLMTIPSIALFGAMIPLLAPLGAGVGTIPAVLALILYSQLPIIRNTRTGLQSVPAPVLRTALALGMSPWQVFWRVRFPLAWPFILSGIRIAMVSAVGIASVAAYIGAGGLGRWIFGGIRRTYPDMVLAGALLISLLAVALDRTLFTLQRFFQRYREQP